MSHSKGAEAASKIPSASAKSSEVLHQRRSLPASPARLAVGGFAIVLTLGYFTLYSKKKPEASASDVARVASGVGARPEHTHPSK